MIYLDHAATTAVYPEVAKAMLPYLTEKYYNPSGAYREGKNVKKELARVRAEIAQSIHAQPEEILFTSGGTEADNWALRRSIDMSGARGRHMITTAMEHHAVLHACQYLETQGCEVTYLRPDAKGRIRVEAAERAIRPDTALISVMYANNEIGTIQPVQELGMLAHRHGILFHTDAVQAYGHLPVDVLQENIDLMSVSAHKFGGPKGVGFLFVKQGTPLQPLIYGGAQERGMRAGTENTAGIVGMGEAVRISGQHRETYAAREQALRDALLHRILSEISLVRLNGDLQNRLPGNLNVSFRGIEAATLIAMLETREIYVSGGSACTSSEKAPSHVLKSIGLSDDMASAAVRITVGHENTKEQMDYVFEVLRTCVQTLRQVG